MSGPEKKCSVGTKKVTVRNRRVNCKAKLVQADQVQREWKRITEDIVHKIRSTR